MKSSQSKSLTQNGFQPFLSGSRICIATHLVMIELRLFAAVFFSERLMAFVWLQVQLTRAWSCAIAFISIQNHIVVLLNCQHEVEQLRPSSGYRDGLNP